MKGFVSITQPPEPRPPQADDERDALLTRLMVVTPHARYAGQASKCTRAELRRIFTIMLPLLLDLNCF